MPIANSMQLKAPIVPVTGQSDVYSIINIGAFLHWQDYLNAVIAFGLVVENQQDSLIWWNFLKWRFPGESFNPTFSVKQTFFDRHNLSQHLKQSHPILTYNVPRYLANDKDFVLSEVKRNHYSFRYASVALKNDIDVALSSAKKSNDALIDIDDNLKKNPNFFIAAFRENLYLLEYAYPTVTDNRDVAIAAAKANVHQVGYLSQRLKKDADFMMIAVQHHGQALQYAHPSLKDNKKIVIAAFKQDIYALNYASDKLKNDKIFVLTAMTINRLAFEFSGDDIKNDPLMNMAYQVPFLPQLFLNAKSMLIFPLVGLLMASIYNEDKTLLSVAAIALSICFIINDDLFSLSLNEDTNQVDEEIFLFNF